MFLIKTHAILSFKIFVGKKHVYIPKTAKTLKNMYPVP